MGDSKAEFVRIAVSARRSRRRGVVPMQREGRARRLLLRGTLAGLALAGGAKGVQAVGVFDTGSNDSGAKVTFVPVAGEKPNFVVEVLPKADAGRVMGLDVGKVTDMEQKIKNKVGWEKEHMQVPLKYEKLIRAKAKSAGFTPELAIGIIAVENGGSDDETNRITGARGVAQFLPATARQYGLKVGDGEDERADSEKSINAMVDYLVVHKKLLGDNEGLAVWSYHAGVGGVMKALRVYFLDTSGEDIGSYTEAIVNNNPQAREAVEKMLTGSLNPKN